MLEEYSTPFGPHSALTIIFVWCYGSKVCVMCDDSRAAINWDFIRIFGFTEGVWDTRTELVNTAKKSDFQRALRNDRFSE